MRSGGQHNAECSVILIEGFCHQAQGRFGITVLLCDLRCVHCVTRTLSCHSVFTFSIDGLLPAHEVCNVTHVSPLHLSADRRSSVSTPTTRTQRPPSFCWAFFPASLPPCITPCIFPRENQGKHARFFQVGAQLLDAALADEDGSADLSWAQSL